MALKTFQMFGHAWEGEHGGIPRSKSSEAQHWCRLTWWLPGLCLRVFRYSKYKLAFKLIEAATVTRVRRGCRHGGPGNSLGDETWDRLTSWWYLITRMTNNVKPAELIQADIWKHTTPTICCSAAPCPWGILCQQLDTGHIRLQKQELSALFCPGNLPFPGTSRWPWTDE